MNRLRWLLLPVLAAVLEANGLAQVPEIERTPVTDPDQLEALGFPRDATNVYRAKSLDGTPSELPEDWGADTHFTTVMPAEFVAQFESDGWISGTTDIVCTGYCFAPMVLPTGVQVEAFRWWAYDSDADEDVFFSVTSTCQPSFAPGPPTVTVLADGATTGSSGYQSGLLSGGGFTVNNRDCYYTVRLQLDGVYPDHRVNKLRVQWKRQISTPPGTATFADVPTNHQFFQHIEALAASGITAGCGGGNFCPAAPVTRGQMAAFLSIALGLYFP